MSDVPTLQPNEFLNAINVALGTSHTSLPDAWVAFLQQVTASPSLDVSSMENVFLQGLTGSTGATIDLWNNYLTVVKAYGGISIPDNIKIGLDTGDLLLDSDTITFQTRVVVDGGTVEDIGFLNSFILDAKQNNYFNDIVAAYSPSWGVKGITDASNLYSITGVATDIAQTVASKQPFIATGDLLSKTRLDFDSASVENFIPKAFTWIQPATLIYGGFQQKAWTGFRIFDGGSSDRTGILQSPSSPSLRLSAGATGVIDSNSIVGTDVHFRALFNAAASVIQVDSIAETMGDAGTRSPDGATINGRGNGTLASDIKIGSIVLLSAAVDGSYTTKMAAIRAFFNSIYGTG